MFPLLGTAKTPVGDYQYSSHKVVFPTLFLSCPLLCKIKCAWLLIWLYVKHMDSGNGSQDPERRKNKSAQVPCNEKRKKDKNLFKNEKQL